MNDLQDILTDIIDLIQSLAYEQDNADVYYKAKDLYDKILVKLNECEKV